MESINIHNRPLNQESYKLITVVCQFCEFHADRTPISTPDYADDTDKRNCCPRTTRKTRSHTAQKIRKIGTQEASEEGKSGGHEATKESGIDANFLGSWFPDFFASFLRPTRPPLHLCALCDLGVSSSPRKNLRKSAKSADYRKSGILPDSADGHLARCHRQAGSLSSESRRGDEGYPPIQMPDVDQCGPTYRSFTLV